MIASATTWQQEDSHSMEVLIAGGEHTVEGDNLAGEPQNLSPIRIKLSRSPIGLHR